MPEKRETSLFKDSTEEWRSVSPTKVEHAQWKSNLKPGCVVENDYRLTRAVSSLMKSRSISNFKLSHEDAPSPNKMTSGRRYMHSPERPHRNPLTLGNNAPKQGKSPTPKYHEQKHSRKFEKALKTQFIDNSGTQMQTLKQLTKRAEYLKSKTESKIFTPQVLKRCSSTKVMQPRQIAPPDTMHQVMKHNEGPKVRLETQAQGKRIQPKVTSNPEGLIRTAGIQNSLARSKSLRSVAYEPNRRNKSTVF